MVGANLSLGDFGTCQQVSLKRLQTEVSQLGQVMLEIFSSSSLSLAIKRFILGPKASPCHTVYNKKYVKSMMSRSSWSLETAME